MTVLSLFDGMSCGQIALNRIGIKPYQYYASEIDKFAIQITQKNYPDTIQLGDVERWQEWSIPWGDVDLVLGGFPCQSWSIAGNRQGHRDERGKLFFTMLDITKKVLESNPNAFFLFENVASMGEEFLTYINSCIGATIGEYYQHTINSSLLSAQNRKRVYWTNIDDIDQPQNKGIVLRDILEKDVDEKYYLSEKTIASYIASNEKFPVFNGKLRPINGTTAAKTITSRAGRRRADNYIIQRPRGYNDGGTFGEKSPTLSSNSWEQNNYLCEGCRIRKLTPVECERLQTVPDNYTAGVSDNQRYKMLGNGWTVDVIAHMLTSMLKGQK